MTNIVGIDGKPVASNGGPVPQPPRDTHPFQINKKDGSSTTIDGVLFVTPFFIAIGAPDTGEFAYIIPYDSFKEIVNLDAVHVATE